MQLHSMTICWRKLLKFLRPNQSCNWHIMWDAGRSPCERGRGGEGSVGGGRGGVLRVWREYIVYVLQTLCQQLHVDGSGKIITASMHMPQLSQYHHPHTSRHYFNTVFYTNIIFYRKQFGSRPESPQSLNQPWRRRRLNILTLLPGSKRRVGSKKPSVAPVTCSSDDGSCVPRHCDGSNTHWTTFEGKTYNIFIIIITRCSAHRH